MSAALLEIADRASSPSVRVTLCGKLSNLFRSKAGQWIDGRELATVAGAYGWRTRVSDLRRHPYVMTIENRVRSIPGQAAKVSEYRFVPPDQEDPNDAQPDGDAR